VHKHQAGENKAAERAAYAARIRYREQQVELCEQRNARAEQKRQAELRQQRNARSTVPLVKPTGRVLRCQPLVGRWRTVQRFLVRKGGVRVARPTDAIANSNAVTAATGAHEFDSNTARRNPKMQSSSPIRTTGACNDVDTELLPMRQTLRLLPASRSPLRRMRSPSPLKRQRCLLMV
jgi:hypothetical protein